MILWPETAGLVNGCAPNSSDSAGGGAAATRWQVVANAEVNVPFVHPLQESNQLEYPWITRQNK
jgi:hypothetical protein